MADTGSPIWYAVVGLMDFSQLSLNSASDVPLYKQLAESITGLIGRGAIQSGDRLPPTRELADQLGLNRTTISAAYAALAEAGLIEGQVGRGSFVSLRESPAVRKDWDAILPALDGSLLPATGNIEISFANSRPAAEAFPLKQFRRLAKEVIDSPDAGEILQLGSPHGFPALRRYLLEQSTAEGTARSGDDLMITSGCQQALDLLARLFVSDGKTVATEDPVYHGALRVFARAGARLISVPVDYAGLDLDALAEALQRHRPSLLVLTASFQNPTGTTIPLDRRKRILDLAQRSGTVLIENDIYSELRYCGNPVPTLKELDKTGDTILLRSYSKVAFPGLRVGWVIAPRAVIARLAEAKQFSDLHSDQLSQAVLLRFAESGELAAHLERTRRAGAERLNAVLSSCGRYLPPGTKFTRPEGGMSLWVELPAPLNAETLLIHVEERGVNFLPGRFFSIGQAHSRCLRISFGGLSPEQITRGVRILGDTAGRELAASPVNQSFEPAAALV